MARPKKVVPPPLYQVDQICIYDDGYSDRTRLAMIKEVKVCKNACYAYDTCNCGRYYYKILFHRLKYDYGNTACQNNLKPLTEARMRRSLTTTKKHMRDHDERGCNI